MPATFKANERCYNRTFGLYGLETLNHRSELKILWDTFRSQMAELWFPYDRRIANDRKRSQTIAEDRTWFYLLRSSAITIAGSQTIAELSAICDPRSSAIIWKPAFKLPNHTITTCFVRRRVTKRRPHRLKKTSSVSAVETSRPRKMTTL